MKYLFLLSLLTLPTTAVASITPNFTTGTMTQTVTATQAVTETVVTERYGAEVNRWNGDNVQPIAVDANSNQDIISALEFEVVDVNVPWQLEITERPAGLIETINTTRTIQTDTTTNTLSVFAQ